jgi:hypothetical protein
MSEKVQISQQSLLLLKIIKARQVWHTVDYSRWLSMKHSEN